MECARIEPELVDLDMQVSSVTETVLLEECGARPASSSSSTVKAPLAQVTDDRPSGYRDVRSWWSRRASTSLVHETPSRPTSVASSRAASISANLGGSGSQWKRLGRDLKGSSEVVPQRCSSASTESGHHGTQIVCAFRGGTAVVEVLTAPVKTLARMREKVLEYSAEAAACVPGSQPGWVWPQAARIVDPIRTSIVCNGPAQILEAFRWFSEGLDGRSGVPICRVKNRFAFDKGEILGG
jgi:hypothetical protein